MRFVRLIVACLLIGAAVPPLGARQPAQGQDKQSPSLKKPEKSVVPTAMLRKHYDRALNLTYVNVDITLLGRADAKQPGGSKGAPAREVKLTFQLVYKGATTADLATTAYLFVESVTGRQEGDRLSTVEQMEINAEGYEYSYARVNYQTELIEATGGVEGTIPLKRETAVFKLPTDDLPQLTNANSLKIKLGAEQFVVKSPQLKELRSTLVSGDE